MNWKKEKPLFRGEGLTKGLQLIFIIPNLAIQHISFVSRHGSSPHISHLREMFS